MVSIGRVIESFRNTLEAVGRSGLIHGLTAAGAGESASMGAELLGLHRLRLRPREQKLGQYTTLLRKLKLLPH